MKRVKIVAIFLFLSFASFSQEKVYMPMFEVLNLHPDYQYSISKLYKTYLDNLNVYFLVLPEKRDTLYNEPLTKTMQYAKEAGAVYFATGEINAVSNNLLVVSLTMYKTDDGKKEWNAMIKAKGMADIDPAMQRLAQAMTTKTKAEEEQDIYNVTEYDSKKLQKVNSSYFWGLTLGGAYPFMKEAGKPSAGLGGLLYYDGRNFMFDVKVEGYFGDVQMYNLNIDAFYPLSSKKHTPYLDAGLGISGTSYSSETVVDYGYGKYPSKQFVSSGGLLFFAGAGYLFNRNSDVNFRTGIRGFASGYKTGNVVPCGIMFNITILIET